jgi:hypothetical protein
MEAKLGERMDAQLGEGHHNIYHNDTHQSNIRHKEIQLSNIQHINK